MTEDTKSTGTWVTITCPSGREVQIRKMKLRDEDIVTDVSLTKNGDNVTRLLESCTSLSARELNEALLGDRTAMLIEIRKLKDPLYYPKIKCESCSNVWEPEVDLGDLRVQTLDREKVDGDFRFQVELPGGRKMVGRLLTGKDERQLARIRRQHGDHLMTHLMMMRTESIEGEKTKRLDTFLDMDSDDAEHFRQEYDAHDCGYDTTVTVVCPACGEEFEQNLPFDQTFFLGTGKRARR